MKNIKFHAPISTDVIHAIPKLILSLGGFVPSYREGYTIKEAIEQAIAWVVDTTNKPKLLQYQKDLALRGIIDYNPKKMYLTFNHVGGYSYRKEENTIIVFPCLRGETYTAISW